MSTGIAASLVLLISAAGAEREATWERPQSREVQATLAAWIDQVQPDALLREAFAKLWADQGESLDEVGLLERVVKSAALADPRARRLLEDCRHPRSSPLIHEPTWLLDPQLPPLAACNLRLYYGRYLAQESYYDEALHQIGELEPEQVVAPTTLLFYQAVVHHRLLDRERGLQAIELLQGVEQGPQRYAAVARLMQEDLVELEDESLDHIARRMDDIRRRLGLGRAGPKVRQVEDGVIASLDKMIKELEDRQQQQQSGGGGGGSNQPSTPATESRILSGKGPGEVVKKDIGSGSGWGNLPPKEREEAMQQVGREFPAHYRETIEQYFRKLASEGSEP